MGYNSNGVFTAGICVDEVKRLMSLEGAIHSPLLKRTPTGFLDFLNSPLNNSGREDIPIQVGSKKKTALIQYLNRSIETQVDETITKNCNAGDYDDFNEVNFDVDKEAEIKWSADETQVAKICQSQGSFFAEIMMAKMDALAQNVNKNSIQDMLGQFGTNLDTGLTSAKQITVFPAATGNPNATALQDLDHDYTVANQMKGIKAIIGAGNIRKYWKTLAAGCCNDGGIDMLELSIQNDASFFTDTQIETYLGANEFMVIEPTTLQLVTYNEYVDDRVKKSEYKANTTITDPRTGLTYDLKLDFDTNCDDKWVWTLRLAYGLFVQPLDAYQVGDTLFGTNGTLRYEAITS